MEKEFIKNKKLLEAHKQFMRLCEYSYVPQSLEEDSEDDTMDNTDMGKADVPMGGTDMQQDNSMPPNNDGGEKDAATDMETPQMGDNLQTMDNGSPMGDESPMGDNSPMGDVNEMPNMDEPMGGENETVIDVDDITNAQEKMNDKVNVVGQNLGDVDKKIETLIQSLSNMEAMINNNNQEIAKFKAEFEKRNPTQTEKLNLRSLDSYPFNVNPKDYWAKKGADPNSNYSGFSNNEEPTTKEYVITNNDVDDFNEKDIEKSFDIEDELKQDINKIFGL